MGTRTDEHTCAMQMGLSCRRTELGSFGSAVPAYHPKPWHRCSISSVPARNQTGRLQWSNSTRLSAKLLVHYSPSPVTPDRLSAQRRAARSCCNQCCCTSLGVGARRSGTKCNTRCSTVRETADGRAIRSARHTQAVTASLRPSATGFHPSAIESHVQHPCDTH